MDRAPESPKRAPETPKPRRHYALTGKGREARLVSLAKAREKARCALRGYRRGPQEDDLAYESRLARQIKPWCANLRRAIGAKKADRSAHYASHFTHGLTAPDLDRSAAAAGEDPDELRRHIERCQGAIGGLIGDCRLKIDDCQNRGSGFGARDSVGADSNPEHRNPNPEPTDRQSSPSSTGNRQSKLVLALAYVLWRALRLMRTQVRWERRAFAYRLQELATWRERHPALTAKRLNQLRSDFQLITGDLSRAWGRLNTLRKRFEALWTARFDPERWQRLARHIREPFRYPNEPMYLAGEDGGGRRRPGSGGAPFGDGWGDPAGDRPASCAGSRGRSAAGCDLLEFLCRTRSRGAQDWRFAPESPERGDSEPALPVALEGGAFAPARGRSRWGPRAPAQ